MALDAVKRKGMSSITAARSARLSSGRSISVKKKEDAKSLWQSSKTNQQIEAESGISYPTLLSYWVTDRIKAGMEPVHRGQRPGQRVLDEESE